MAAENTELVVVVDLSCVTVSLLPGRVCATLDATGEVLGSLDLTEAVPGRVASARLLDSLLSSARLWRDGGWRRLVWYHPHTARLAIAMPKGTATLWAGGPFPVDPAGTLGRFSRNGPEGMSLEVAEARAVEETPDLESAISTLFTAAG